MTLSFLPFFLFCMLDSLTHHKIQEGVVFRCTGIIILVQAKAFKYRRCCFSTDMSCSSTKASNLCPKKTYFSTGCTKKIIPVLKPFFPTMKAFNSSTETYDSISLIFNGVRRLSLSK